jgi:1-phosphatidylinositol-3-phosphate 5-kinase
MSLKCQNANCKKFVLDHVLSFIHKDGQISFAVERLESRLPPPPPEVVAASTRKEAPIAMWSYCHNCGRYVTPLVYISDDVWNFSFGKFLEVFFYNKTAAMDPALTGGCSCNMQASTTLYFGCDQLATRVTYVPVRPYAVYVRRHLPLDADFHRTESGRNIGEVRLLANVLLNKFRDKTEEMTREIRALFQTAANKPEHLQAVLGELVRVGKELEVAKKDLEERIEMISATQRVFEQSRKMGGGGRVVSKDKSFDPETADKFPWQTRRHLFLLCTSWNERLSLSGAALLAMKKLGVVVTGGGAGESSDIAEEVVERVKRMLELKSTVDERGSTTALVRAKQEELQGRLSSDGNDFTAPVASGSGNVPGTGLTETFGADSVEVTEGGSAVVTASAEEGVSVDVQHNSSTMKKAPSEGRGNGVKNALNRFFNRGSTVVDPYVVDLSELGRGRPRLEPGVNGEGCPVYEDQPSTIIAYSLMSVDYADQFGEFSEEFKGRQSNRTTASEKTTGASERGSNSSRQDAKDAAKAKAKDVLKGNSSKDSNSSSGKERSGFEDSIDDSPGTLDRTKSLEGIVFPSHKIGQGGSVEGMDTGGKDKATQAADDKKELERRLLQRGKSHIKHHFRDVDEKDQTLCKYVCTSYWATQFQALRRVFLGGSEATPSSGKQPEREGDEFGHLDDDSGYIKSLSTSFFWEANGGKSGAAFSKTADGRFVVKCISRTELQMFLDCAPAYFEYLSKAFFHGLPTCLCRIVGVYQIGYHNRVTNSRSMLQVAVMQNVFYGRKISKIFDLKGSMRGRYVVAGGGERPHGGTESEPGTPKDSDKKFFGDGEDPQKADQNLKDNSETVLLDENFLEFTSGMPLPLTDRAKALFHMSILNDTLFLSIINIIDYSILVGIDEEKHELVVGILDYMRQYDIIKQMERVGKSVSMIAGQDAPTIIQPIAYRNRFQAAMERFFSTTPTKWTTTSSEGEQNLG